MGKVILDAAMSVDGYWADSCGQSVYPVNELQGTAIMAELISTTGAVVMSRHSYAMASDPDWYVGNYEYQVPIFVLSADVPAKPPKQSEQLTFTYVQDGIKHAIRQATVAAGKRNVMVIGEASAAQQSLNSDMLDELVLRVIPVVLGSGTRLFDHIGHCIRLQQLDLVETLNATHMRFSVHR